jgi:hypothetical protein
MENSIRLHKEFGVNPTILKCFLCGEDKNEIALLGASYKGQAPMHMCIDQTPCDKCKEYMKQGVILISVRDGESGSDPYRTGGWCVVKREAMTNIIDDPKLLEKGAMFVPDPVWKQLGLPKFV